MKTFIIYIQVSLVPFAVVEAFTISGALALACVGTERQTQHLIAEAV